MTIYTPAPPMSRHIFELEKPLATKLKTGPPGSNPTYFRFFRQKKKTKD